MTRGLGDETRHAQGFAEPKLMPVPDRPTVERGPVVTQRPRWQTRYMLAVVLVDVVATSTAILVDIVVGFGTESSSGSIALPLALLTVLLVVVGLRAQRAWDPRILGAGSEEFNRLLRGFAIAGILLCIIGLATLLSATRPWVFGVIPLAAVLATLGRLALRKWLHMRRRSGSCVLKVLAVGCEDSLVTFLAGSRRDTSTGWSVAGICTPTATGRGRSGEIRGVPVVGDLDSVASIALSGHYDAVAVAAAPGWSPARLRRLAWDLEGTRIELVVDPGLMEVAGPRLHITPVDGLPLLRLTQPDFSGAPWLVKHAMDRVGAALLLLILSPLLLMVAAAVKLDGGPVFYRQVRVGRHGVPFRMVKFRSMTVDADRRRDALLPANDGAGPLFKMRQDPRVTRFGAVLRRYSMDELPQLLNVLSGAMTLVGPRPPLPEEVATYDREAQRKLLVRPGLTGLWQVSGRSDLTWEEAVRLDLRYVENWTLALDALILWKTLGAVVRGSGAY